MDKFLIFIIFLGPLVFFHELGHFLFARLFGVRVETFSIGFGPKILSFKKGDTQYALSLIPLGGYVKMYGDNILERDSVPEEERSYAYTHKPVWQRFWIVFGGPLANFLMAFVIFVFLFMNGESGRVAKIGYISQDSKIASLNLVPGDIVEQINDKKIININDLSGIEESSEYELTIARADQKLKKQISISKEELIISVGQAMAYPLRQPLIVNKKGDFFALSYQSHTVNWNISYEEMIQLGKDKTIWIIPIVRNAKKNDQNTFDEADLVFNKSEKINLDQSLFKSFFPADLSVKSLVMEAPADKAGIKANDVIYSVSGEKVTSFYMMRNLIQKYGPKGVIKVELFHKGKLRNIDLKPNQDPSSKLYQVGVYRRTDFMTPAMTQSQPKGFIEALSLGFKRTISAMGEIFMTFKMLITAKASMKNLGGPIAIGKFAAASFYTGLTQFLAFMAMMSVNLGIINLFPIPVLDGGHIVFLIVEFFNRGPVSKKVMSIAYQVGFSLLIMMLGVALFNDISNLF